MHVVVAVSEQRVTNWSKNPRLVAAEIVGGDQVQCSLRFRLVVVMPCGLYQLRLLAT